VLCPRTQGGCDRTISDYDKAIRFNASHRPCENSDEIGPRELGVCGAPHNAETGTDGNVIRKDRREARRRRVRNERTGRRPVIGLIAGNPPSAITTFFAPEETAYVPMSGSNQPFEIAA
jgi:hypothetical protein